MLNTTFVTHTWQMVGYFQQPFLARECMQSLKHLAPTMSNEARKSTIHLKRYQQQHCRFQFWLGTMSSFDIDINNVDQQC